MPTISADIIIVNYLTGDLVAHAIQRLYADDFNFLVYDNSGEVQLEPSNQIALISSGINDYYSKANNICFGMCSADYTLLLNPDVLLDSADLRTMIARLAEIPQAWALAPRLLNPDGTDQNYLHGYPTSRALLADRFPPLRRIFRGEYRNYVCAEVDLKLDQWIQQPPAACLLLKRRAVGNQLFDETFRLFFNDADLALRMRKHGAVWYAGSITAIHEKGASLARANIAHPFSMSVEYDRSLMHFAKKHRLNGWRFLVATVRIRRWLGLALMRLHA